MGGGGGGEEYRWRWIQGESGESKGVSLKVMAREYR